MVGHNLSYALAPFGVRLDSASASASAGCAVATMGLNSVAENEQMSGPSVSCRRQASQETPKALRKTNRQNNHKSGTCHVPV